NAPALGPDHTLVIASTTVVAANDALITHVASRHSVARVKLRVAANPVKPSRALSAPRRFTDI
ncbi:MAG: hypothetical protein KF830_15060, partial [Planctomycetes bacterium]|nr:hypothetical protein [Planctomycetota bacterium]